MQSAIGTVSPAVKILQILQYDTKHTARFAGVTNARPPNQSPLRMPAMMTFQHLHLSLFTLKTARILNLFSTRTERISWHNIPCIGLLNVNWMCTHNILYTVYTMWTSSKLHQRSAHTKPLNDTGRTLFFTQLCQGVLRISSNQFIMYGFLTVHIAWNTHSHKSLPDRT